MVEKCNMHKLVYDATAQAQKNHLSSRVGTLA